jgi:parallel beta-helix repeat protein
LGGLAWIGSNDFNVNSFLSENGTPSEFYIPLASQSYTIEPLIIDESGNSGLTWTELALLSEPWFSGNGVKENPYIISNLEISANYSDSYTLQILHSNAYLILRNCTFQKVEPIIKSSLITMANSSNIVIEQNIFKNSEVDGISIIGECKKIRIEQNNFENITNYGVRILENSSSIHLEGNNFVLCRNSALAISDYVKNIKFLNNYITNSSIGIDISYGSFLDLINNTIVSSTYGIFIDYSFQGRVADNTIFECYDSIRLYGVKGFFFKQNIVSHSLNIGIRISGSSNNNTFYQNTVNNSADFGIYVHDSAHMLNFKENYIANNGYSGIGTEIGCYDIKFEKNIIIDNGYDGIFINDMCYYYTIIDNFISGNEGHGISLDSDFEYGLIQSNLIQNNSGNGIMLQNTAQHVDIVNNTIVEHNIGIFNYPTCDHNTIIHNVIRQSTQYGIYLTGGFAVKIISNLIYENGKGIVIVNSPTALEVYWNLFYDNDEHAISNSSGSANLWNTGEFGNYWSEFPLTDENFDGVGDTLYNISGSGNAYDYHPIWDAISPSIIPNQSNYQFLSNQSIKMVEFSITDPTIFQAHYFLYINDTLMDGDAWIDNQTIQYTMPDLTPGDYEFKIIASDGFDQGFDLYDLLGISILGLGGITEITFNVHIEDSSINGSGNDTSNGNWPFDEAEWNYFLGGLIAAGVPMGLIIALINSKRKKVK